MNLISVRLSTNSLNEQLTHKPTTSTMQLTTLTTMLFAAVAIAGPIALPEKVAAFNIKVRIQHN
jgi:hypothetical protein